MKVSSYSKRRYKILVLLFLLLFILVFLCLFLNFLLIIGENEANFYSFSLKLFLAVKNFFNLLSHQFLLFIQLYFYTTRLQLLDLKKSGLNVTCKSDFY